MLPALHLARGLRHRGCSVAKGRSLSASLPLCDHTDSTCLCIWPPFHWTESMTRVGLNHSLCETPEFIWGARGPSEGALPSVKPRTGTKSHLLQLWRAGLWE